MDTDHSLSSLAFPSFSAKRRHNLHRFDNDIYMDNHDDLDVDMDVETDTDNEQPRELDHVMSSSSISLCSASASQRTMRVTRSHNHNHSGSHSNYTMNKPMSPTSPTSPMSPRLGLGLGLPPLSPIPSSSLRHANAHAYAQPHTLGHTQLTPPIPRSNTFLSSSATAGSSSFSTSGSTSSLFSPTAPPLFQKGLSLPVRGAKHTQTFSTSTVSSASVSTASHSANSSRNVSPRSTTVIPPLTDTSDPQPTSTPTPTSSTAETPANTTETETTPPKPGHKKKSSVIFNSDAPFVVELQVSDTRGALDRLENNVAQLKEKEARLQAVVAALVERVAAIDARTVKLSEKSCIAHKRYLALAINRRKTTLNLTIRAKYNAVNIVEEKEKELYRLEMRR